ncbi:Imm50 family immunity protein [Streptomyces sp. NBC_01766]|uniref:Imm50 family immunity protein n=1 Tax=Streptomyces sp. NBC_01766 TaxID=2975936 RepID=UPI002DDA9D9F|nr:Imm50 family immunity protein [Streptomyces sp. NBC_01766]WSC20598.1 immunity 50 family protein [Streptomyces sp. NBC_01766]
MTWVDSIRNPEVLASLFGDSVPTLKELRLRSVHLSYIGPSVTLRVDLPAFPAAPAPEWRENEFDTLQCQIGFQAVENICLNHWTPPEVCEIQVTLQADYRMHVEVVGRNLRLSFTSSQDILIDHISAFKIGSDGSDSGRHHYVRKVDARLYTSTPEIHETSFYGRH